MIENEEQLQQATEQLGRMYRALAALRAEVLPSNPRRYALMADGPLHEIRALQVQIDEYAGVAEAEEHEADVWLRLHGPSIAWPQAPAKVLTAFIRAVRNGVERVARRYTDRLGLSPEIVDLQISALKPGSLRIGFCAPAEQASILPESEGTVVERALSDYARVAAWVASEEGQGSLTQAFPDAVDRRILLNAIKPILPRPRGAVESVEVYGHMVPRPGRVYLGAVSAGKLNEAIDNTVGQTGEVMEYVGALREIDLDRQSFKLREVEEQGEVHCKFPPDLLDDAKNALDRKVRVAGVHAVRRGEPRELEVSRLEIVRSRSTRRGRGRS
jgi:hypothetical protein